MMHDPRPYEQSVLGALLLTSDARPHLKRLIAEGLSFTHFYYGRHREVFTAMIALADRDETVDVLTVVAELERRGKADQFRHRFGGAQEYVHSLPNVVPSAAGLKDYAKRVMEMSAVRRKTIAAKEMVQACEREDYPAIQDAERRLALIELPGAKAMPARRLGVVSG